MLKDILLAILLGFSLGMLGMLALYFMLVGWRLLRGKV